MRRTRHRHHRPRSTGWTRREFIRTSAASGAAYFLVSRFGMRPRIFAAPLPGGTLNPASIPKYASTLVIPPAMPVTAAGPERDYYEIAVRQFTQQILPKGLPKTTVWSYGSATESGTFNYPAFTIEAQYGRPTRVKWINGLVNAKGKFLPHLLPVDQTLHWANPPGGVMGRDMRGSDPTRYTGPVPIVTHVHGAHVTDESDGYAEAWYLPSATNIPKNFARTGTWYDFFKGKFNAAKGIGWEPGSATFEYANDQAATTLWYHDHSLGMTRLNVYAGPAGFYLLRGGDNDLGPGLLPTTPYEIPIAVQDRSFNLDGSLFYPDNRAFFEGLSVNQLHVPFIPDASCGLPSDVSPIWNPEFFGNTMVVNGRTWPTINVEAQGFLEHPVELQKLLMAPAERADVVVDFAQVPVGTEIFLINEGPDEPFGGGEPPDAFPWADVQTTGQVMRFKVVNRTSEDTTTPPDALDLPARAPLASEGNTRQVSIHEAESATVRIVAGTGGTITAVCGNGEPFGPTHATLGDGVNPLKWMEAITETPDVGATEVWEIHNTTEDAHPIHIHQVAFEVVNREDASQVVRPPEAWESGLKDTVIAYPGEITRVKATFDLPGQYVWHCHIVEHEDNEMMRPFRVGPPQDGEPSV
jgi:bilirubin oxidase